VRPWVDVSAGPLFLHRTGRAGLNSGPLVRLHLGIPLGERFAAELWTSGALQSAPLGTPGDSAIASGGVGGRMMMYRFGGDGQLSLWAHGGLGWSAAAAGDGPHGPTAFGGAALWFQPIIRRFSVGVETDAIGASGGLGFAVMPSLRCSL
jgi:hypothetical protein